ncbi:family 2A encapsulin nanocompartment cargo protein cysteine desulfurase [Methylophilus sp. VKM B-3414]|uniref:family 2A encapsulin nanocompartment cargo protein cysteine desulfurase n=1 Tax=Methylophilus sp. VKM B-3414 TaxID=3076121 RepID=UPI0028CA7616|nr:family 2A encapsulin nanocompartment cargo protein cysteine desulfurase [Methylophilus sp. VKM B-3414]MDT7848359.1 family 2A encapsulin nanocompartment cargo protein cysteine desulfurase [Methylophilus sp. VKM B-3414]
MTTSNSFGLTLTDGASFEPEAILASLPGEHPKMTAALGVGRELENTGVLDTATLTQLVNDLYAEGFPATAPFAAADLAQSLAASHAPQPSVPPTDSLTTKLVNVGGTGGVASPSYAQTQAQPVTQQAQAQQLTYVPGIEALGSDPLHNHPAHLNVLQPEATFLTPGSFAGTGIEIPYQQELDRWLGAGAIKSPPSAASSQTAAKPPVAGAQSFYFLQAEPGLMGSLPASAHPAFDVHAVRRDFPILNERVNGRQLVWFDNAATTQKPQVVIDRVSYFYQHENSNIHRAAHALAARATDAYEEARETVRRFINAPSVNQVIFVRGTTEAINLVAKTWGKKHLGQGDEIVVSHLEHHANIVPWQQLCQETGAVLKVIPVDDSGQILLEEYQKLLTAKTKLVSFTQVSNALGTVTPAQEMIAMAHRAGAKVLLDGAQSVSHMRTDVQTLDADFFVFSGHKIFGPTGIGALYGKADVLQDMPAWQGGGNMIQDVTFEKTVYHAAPAKFEAGTGNIADAVGLGAALQYVERLGIENIAAYEHALLEYATAAMCQIPNLRLIGTAKHKASVLSFALKGYQSEEVGAALNEEGIAVRSGHHCAQPILRRFGVETTVRPSLAFYNTYDEIDRMIAVLQRLASYHA